MILILFTASYPYDGSAEQTFLNREIEYLASSFEKVALIPQACCGNRLRTPPNVDVVEDYAVKIRENHPYRSAFLSGLFYKELLAKGPRLLEQPKLDKLVAFVAGAEFTAKWVCRYMDENSFEPDQCIFYTYWFDRATLGLGLLKERRRICVVSRAHGSDLYEERHEWSYIPCRRQALSLVDELFPDSDKGTRYLLERYPRYSEKFKTARLGVPEPGFITSSSQDGTLRVASCSFLVPLKRIDLLLRGMAEAAKLRSHQPFEWNHFGTGPLKESLEQLANEILPRNVKHDFRGYLSQDSLMRFYRENPVDVFVNVSEKEGTPVAVMEAISCGIPVVATAVGGNPEIVTEKNGLLLGPDPSAGEIADALFFFLDNPAVAKTKRMGSREVWEDRYNSERNFPDFVSRLQEIRKKVTARGALHRT